LNLPVGSSATDLEHNMALLDELFEFIGKEEGFTSTRGARAYLDPPGNLENQYSVGYGHLIKEEEIARGFLLLVDNTRVPIIGVGGGQTTITQPQAVSLFNRDITFYLTGTERVVGPTTWAKLTDGQKAALVSYSYNAGVGNAREGTGFAGFYNRNGFKEALDSGNYVRAGEILRDFGVRTAKVNGVRQVVQGLVNRRRTEGTKLANRQLTSTPPQPGIIAQAPVVSADEYFQNNYVNPINDRNIRLAIEQRKFVTIFSLPTSRNAFTNSAQAQSIPLQEFVRNNALVDATQLAGELSLLRGTSAVAIEFVEETKSVVTRLDGLLPKEGAYLVTYNLFELYPDLMRQKMSANSQVDATGEAPNYSHAWRAPGKLAITANVTIPGASGFRIGQVFQIGRTYEHYKKFGAFQLFGLTETIDLSRGWTTELYARFNAIPQSKLVGLQTE
jgi:GH24 family phage-related lysozyme (muramidase)